MIFLFALIAAIYIVSRVLTPPAQIVTKQVFDTDDSVPDYWLDDYCQIEILPKENLEFIIREFKQIESVEKTESFTDIHERGRKPITTLSKEIRVDYLERTLTSQGLSKAEKILYERIEMMDAKKGKIRAFYLPDFIFFYEIEDEFIKNIWLKIDLLVSVTEIDVIEQALYILGEEYDFLLVDWISLKIVDLASKTEVRRYLMDYWK